MGNVFVHISCICPFGLAILLGVPQIYEVLRWITPKVDLSVDNSVPRFDRRHL